ARRSPLGLAGGACPRRRGRSPQTIPARRAEGVGRGGVPGLRLRAVPQAGERSSGGRPQTPRIVLAMGPFVCAAVLSAAACHAGWNATIKRGLDPLATTVLISIGAAIVSAVFLPVVGLPAAAAWPWCCASVLIHLVYFAALIESYRAGDMGQVYPIARGSAPLMTAIATTAFIGERLGLLGWTGILLLAGGGI